MHSSQKQFEEINKQINCFISTLKEKNEGRKTEIPLDNRFLFLINKKVFVRALTPIPKNDPNLPPEENLNEIFVPNFNKKIFLVSGQVNYVVESVETTHFNHDDTPKFHLLSMI